ncbi:uncharacterized protein F4807DRAFT_440113 [Annulohypoxylon truncatum]|uniref:uncharacterized protein n=1 Tax=Annulohypoxylon truncatum TaxID=327061 RepID=UPI00200816F7|nr:uncharacterized protein F4807DRAFT_440113 [Annulohypoxylon truncatum]KAI1206161.1 hypothetical protein F4807DRAFT_440113 [Annulohypoxylon truncatum]
MMIRDILEKEDDRASLAALTRCNTKFRSIMETHLYMRFITNSKQPVRVRSLASFIHAVGNSPRLASFVKAARISTVIPGGDRVLMYGSEFAEFLVNVAPSIQYQLMRSVNGAPLSIYRLATAMMEVLPTLLPNLQDYHMHTGIFGDSAVNPWWLSYPNFWAMKTPQNRLHHLTDLTITQVEPTWHFTTFFILHCWSRVAPNIRSLAVRTIAKDPTPGRQHAFTKRRRQLAPSSALRLAIRNLRDFRFQCDDYDEVMELFHFLWRCRKIERIDLELKDPGFPWDGFVLDSVNDWLWEIRRNCLEPALLPAARPPDLGPDHPVWTGIFTLRYHTNMKQVIINQDMLELIAGVHRLPYGQKDLVRFLPKSLQVLYLCDLSVRSMSAI